MEKESELLTIDIFRDLFDDFLIEKFVKYSPNIQKLFKNVINNLANGRNNFKEKALEIKNKFPII